MGLEFYDFEGCVVVFELEIGLIRIETAEQFAILGAVLKGLRYGRKLLHSLSQFLITYILIHDGGQGVDYWLIYIRHPFIDILTYGIRENARNYGRGPSKRRGHPYK